MKNPDQIVRYTNDELMLLKSMFADDLEKLYIIRKVMFGFELTEQEQKQRKAFMTEHLYAVLVKTFLPYLDADAPLFQMTHLNLALGADIKTLSPEGAWPYIKAKELEMQYISERLKVLNGDTVKNGITLHELQDLSGDQEEVYVHILAWNWILSFVDTNIMQLKQLAGLKHETPEQTLQRLRQDSAK